MGAVLIEFSTVIGSQDKVASEIEPGRIVELDTVGARSQLLFSAVPVTASRDPGSGNFLPLAISPIPRDIHERFQAGGLIRLTVIAIAGVVVLKLALEIAPLVIRFPPVIEIQVFRKNGKG